MTHKYETRPLTEEEIARMPDSIGFSDIAMLSSDGNWYYAESSMNVYEDGNVYDDSQFIADEDGEYIPV